MPFCLQRSIHCLLSTHLITHSMNIFTKALRMVIRLYLLGPLALLLGALPTHAANAEAQQQVKAQFIYNFVNYVEWPSDAFEGPNSSIKLCLYGDVPFAAYLLSFSGSIVGQRELTFIIGNTINDIYSGCHILYVGDDKRIDLPTLWSQIQYVYVLSVGEREGFTDNGGIINILRTKDRLEFDVNINNALSNGLFLDSDLLALARTIKRNTAPKND